MNEHDKQVLMRIQRHMTDIEAFPDMTDYQYYARTLGLDKDHFLDPAIWEVFYNEEINDRFKTQVQQNLQKIKK